MMRTLFVVLAVMLTMMLTASVAVAGTTQINLQHGSPNQLSTAAQIPAASTIVQPPADLVDQLLSGEEVEITLPGPLGGWTIQGTLFDVLTPQTRAFAATPEGDVDIDIPAHAFVRGSIKGSAGSRVFLAAFETHLTAIIELDQPGGLRRFVISPDTVISGRMAPSIVHEVDLRSSGDERCHTEEMAGYLHRADSLMAAYNQPLSQQKSTARDQRSVTLALQLALECDAAYYARHNSSLAFAAQYALTLAGACSAIFQRDANVALQVPFLRVWTYEDPYVGDIGDRLNNIRTYWTANMGHVERAATCLLSGAGGGGLAWVGVLCGAYGYNVSGVNGSVNFPATGYIWDINVTAHELGHNIGSPHSHNCSWNPPLDSCWYAEGGCYDAILAQRGTIMSYCHLQYTGNALTFHPRVASLFNKALEYPSCVAPVADILDSDVAVVDITVVPTGGVIQASTPFTPTAVIRNLGKAAAETVAVTCRLTNMQNDTLWTSEATTSLVPGAVARVVMPETMIADTGDYLLEFIVASANDRYARNDRMTRPFAVGPAPDGSITVVYPNGGEVFTAGDSVGIAYTATGVERVNAEFSTDGGVTWLTARARTAVGDSPIAWFAPGIPTEKALVRLVSLENGAISDVSDTTFAIRVPRDAAAVEVLWPGVNAATSIPTIPQVVVRNAGSQDLKNVEVQLVLRWVRMNQPAYDQRDTIALLAAGQTDTLILPQIELLARGVHVMQLSVSVDGDMNADNDRYERQFTSAGIEAPHSVRLEHGPRRVIVRWDPSELQSGDLVELWRGTSGVDMVRVKTLRTSVDTWVDTPLTDGTTYAYQLRTQRGSLYSVFTDQRSAIPATYPRGQEPSAPQLIGPSNNATDVPLPSSLVWATVPGADRYEVQIATDLGFSDIHWVYVTQSSDALPLPVPAASTWWWRVRAINESFTGDWSRSYRFATSDICAGQALAFNGEDARATNANFQWNGGPVTVEWWQYVATTDRKNSSVFSVGAADAPGNRMQAHCPWGNGRIYWDYGAIADSGRLVGTYPAFDRWVHVALVSDGKTVMRIYTDGELNAERTGAMEPTALLGITIGAQHQANWFTGIVDEFRVWTVARTQEQIKRTMARGDLPTNDQQGLYALWRMDEGTGLTSADASGRGLTLTLNGGTEWTPSQASINCTPPAELASTIVDRPGTVPATSVHRYSFSWQPTEAAEWYEVEVYPSDTIDGNWLHRVRNVQGTEVTLRGLPASTTCAWRVRAMSTKGAGPWTTAAIVTPAACASEVISFAGANDHVMSPDVMYNGRATTVEYWAQVAKGDVDNRAAFMIGEDDDAKRRFQAHAPWRDSKLFFDHGDYRNGGRLETSYESALDRWAHIAMTSNGIDEMHLYVDGQEVARSSFGSTSGVLRTATIGANTVGGFLFKGGMSDFRLWNVMRSQEQIRESMYERIVGGRSHLLGNWPLDDGLPTTAEDVSGATWDASTQQGVELSWQPDTLRPMMQVPPSLRGPYVAIKGDTVTYSLHADRSVSATFRVRNGIIIDRPTSRSIRVQWVDNTSLGEMCVTRTFEGGCMDSACFDIPLLNPVGIREDLASGGKATIAPNPASGIARVQWAFPAQAIEVRDVMGRVVMRQAEESTATVHELDTTQWASGSYHVRVIGLHQAVTLPLVIAR